MIKKKKELLLIITIVFFIIGILLLIIISMNHKMFVTNTNKQTTIEKDAIKQTLNRISAKLSIEPYASRDIRSIIDKHDLKYVKTIEDKTYGIIRQDVWENEDSGLYLNVYWYDNGEIAYDYESYELPQ